MEPSAETAKNQDVGRQWDMDLVIGSILQVGVLISLVLIAAGLVWRWIATGRLELNYYLGGVNLFKVVVRDMRLLAKGTVRPHVLVTSGIVVLMLTPYFRVLASVLYFVGVLKNWKYTVFTSVVLAVLTYSLFLV